VLILNNLFVLSCTKIVQNGLCLARVTNKRVRAQEQSQESKNASGDGGATGPINTITWRV
jgi:hypothetical protein